MVFARGGLIRRASPAASRPNDAVGRLARRAFPDALHIGIAMEGTWSIFESSWRTTILLS
jgi:hypothetical protein